jgi:hypothetical protein
MEQDLSIVSMADPCESNHIDLALRVVQSRSSTVSLEVMHGAPLTLNDGSSFLGGVDIEIGKLLEKCEDSKGTSESSIVAVWV